MPKPKNPNWFDDEVVYRRAIELWASGMETTDIAIDIGVTPSMLTGRAQRDRRSFPARRDGSAGRPGAKKHWNNPEKGAGAEGLRLAIANSALPPKPAAYCGAVVAPPPKPADIRGPFTAVSTCLYPTGDSPRIRFECREPTHMGLPYCLDHALRCYEPSAHSRIRDGITREFA